MMDSWTEGERAPAQHNDLRALFVPLVLGCMLTGWVAADDALWLMWGAVVGAAMWFGYATVQIVVRAGNRRLQ